WHKINLACAYYRAGQLEQALRSCGELPVNTPGFGDLLRAMVHYRLDHTAEARKWLDRADRWYESTLERSLATTGPELSVGWWHEVALFQIWRHEAEKLMHSGPSAGETLLQLIRGRAFALLGNTKKAEEEFQAAVAARPQDPRVWWTRGRLFD